MLTLDTNLDAEVFTKSYNLGKTVISSSSLTPGLNLCCYFMAGKNNLELLFSSPG